MEIDNFMIIKPADRISTIKPYFFASLASKISNLKENGIDIIRIDIGSPDMPPQQFIIDELTKVANNPKSHGYTPNGGTTDFRKSISDYYLNRFGVSLNPSTEVLALIGSKEGLFHFTQVMVNPGDLVLVPDPGYPVYAGSTIIAGGEVFNFPLLEENNFLPDLENIPQEIVQKAKIMWINYPNNPTGAVASLNFFEKLIHFAQDNNIIIAHDAPYVEVCFDGYVAPSILQVPGAKEVAVEFNSLSKSYNMAGWRIGMVVGNPDIIRYINTYKSQMDSSLFAPILSAGQAALTGSQEWLAARNQIYKERRDLVVSGLQTVGFKVNAPPAAIYIWAKLPVGFNDSVNVCNRLLEETGVSITPGLVYGKFGEGYIRISLGSDTQRLSIAIERIKNWFKSQV